MASSWMMRCLACSSNTRAASVFPRSKSTLALCCRQRCIEILSDRLAEQITLAELAGEFGLSPWHFSRLFKQATGFPPHEYQLQLRIQRARSILAHSPSRTIADIAYQLGFAEESHFRRHFRRIVGTTPGKFRAQQ